MAERCLSIDESLPPKRAYSRTKSSARFQLEEEIASTYHSTEQKDPYCAILPSGMAAISACFYAFFGNPGEKTLLLSNELYCDTPTCAASWRKEYNFKRQTFDVCDSQWLLNYCKKSQSPTMMFLESCSNPSGKILDWSIIAELKKLNPNLVICVDNTWLTSIFFNPFCYGVDVVLESMTKYRSAGRVIGGFVCGQQKFIEVVKKYITLNGMFIGADHCEIFTRAQKNLHQRVSNASELAQKVAEWLEKDSNVTVLTPSLPAHPCFKIFNGYCNLKTSPSVFLIHIKSNCSLRDIENVKYPHGLRKETSYGSAHSKIDPWPRLGSSGDYFATKNTLQQGVWLRISVGYDDEFLNLRKNLQTVIEHFQGI